MRHSLLSILILAALTGCTKKDAPLGAGTGAPAPDAAPAAEVETKAGAKGFAEGRCWDVVNETDFSWPDGCKGAASTTQMCAMVIVPLTEDEKKQFQAWAAAGKPETPCQKSPN